MSEALFELEDDPRLDDDGRPGRRSHRHIDALSGSALKEAVEADARTIADAIGKPTSWVLERAAKVAQIAKSNPGDVHDWREVLRELEEWVRRPALCAARLPKRPYGKQPDGPGRMPRPKKTKSAAYGGSCGLCTDKVPTGQLIARLRRQEDPYADMGWLCEHCAYERRARPRRKDIALRLFHALFAGEPVSFNPPECTALNTWLTEDPATAQTIAWKAEQLDVTVQRLEVSVTEGKDETWLSHPTAASIVEALNEVPIPAGAELLCEIAQHLAEWKDGRVPALVRRFGTGTALRQHLLAATTLPTGLSRLGGPFDLNQSAKPDDDAEAEDPGQEVTDEAQS
jgi:hypothetical protein